MPLTYRCWQQVDHTYGASLRIVECIAGLAVILLSAMGSWLIQYMVQPGLIKASPDWSLVVSTSARGEDDGNMVVVCSQLSHFALNY